MPDSRSVFPTPKKENFSSIRARWLFNLFPVYRRTGGRVCFISEDWKEVHVRLSRNFFTRNYVGTVFGGSIYACLDPIFMLQLIQILGKDYVAWDKAAHIKFMKPITGTVYARCSIRVETIEHIKTQVAANQKYVKEMHTAFHDAAHTVYAETTKTLYIADKNYYRQRQR